MESKEAPQGGMDVKKAVMAGAIWTIAGIGFYQVLRLASSMIMTRLLFPRAFGVMSLVYVVMQGLQMFSDVGIGPALIQHKRGEDPLFVNTAWTIQVIRGFALWICAMLFSWPAAIWFKEPDLMKLIPVASLTAVISGFASTSLFLLNRKLVLGKQTMIDLITQSLGLVIGVALAWKWRSVWVLVFGSLIGAIIRTVLTHVMLPGIPHRFVLDKTCAGELMRFGRWIFISTALTFFSLSGDRLVLGRMMDKDDLGVYTVASNWSTLAIAVLSTLGGRVFFPLYSHLAREESENMLPRFRKARIGLLAMTLPLPCIIIIFGRYINKMMYDVRYAEAGVLMEILGIGVVFQAINQTMSPIILAKGDSFRHMCSMAIYTSLNFAMMLAGGYLGGIYGIIWGIVLTQIIYYPILGLLIKKSKTWMPGLDMLFILLSAAVIIVGRLVIHGLHPMN